jgi:cytochrome c oxidase cbb3-type subunit I/II
MNHDKLETKGLVFAVLATLVVLVGGIVEIVPLFKVQAAVPHLEAVKPYTALELEGRDIYIREGCYLCHSQQVRPFRDETERYGPYSKAGEFVYDHPFQWGSKRIGPDLQRVGGKYPNAWHYMHMRNPRDVTPESIMPNYPWLYTRMLDTTLTQRKLAVQQKLGVPYTDADVTNALTNLRAQADGIAQNLRTSGAADAQSDREIVALIAYLQRLGTDIGWRNNVGAR